MKIRKKFISHAIFIGLSLLFIPGFVLAAPPEPGTVINKDNVDQYEAYLPLYLKGYVKNGWGFSKPLEFSVMAPKDVYIGQSFVDASMKNYEKFSISEDGALEGDYMSGVPFPEILEKKPEEIKDFATKLMYNHHFRYRGDDLYSFFPTCSKRRNSLHKTAMNFYVELLFSGRTSVDPIPEIANHSDLRRARFINSMTPPAKDFKLLEWRYKDPRKTDDTWAYIPTLRRTLRLVSSERTNPIRGSINSYEDAGGFDGKPFEFNYTFLGEKDVLACMHQTTVPTDYPDGFREPLLSDDREIVKTYLIEIRAKSKHHPASKRLVWIDTKTFNILHMELYDKAGVLWKVLEEPMGTIKTVDGDLATFPTAMSTADVKTECYQIILFDRPVYNSGIPGANLYPTTFYQYTGYNKDLW